MVSALEECHGKEKQPNWVLALCHTGKTKNFCKGAAVGGALLLSEQPKHVRRTNRVAPTGRKVTKKPYHRYGGGGFCHHVQKEKPEGRRNTWPGEVPNGTARMDDAGALDSQAPHVKKGTSGEDEEGGRVALDEKKEGPGGGLFFLKKTTKNTIQKNTPHNKKEE